MTADIPTEVLHQLYRGYCLAKFPYTPGVWVSEEARQSRIDYDASSYYEVHEDGSGGHVGPLAELVKAAFAAGRESVWAEAETEYRVCRTYPTASGKLCIDQFVTLEDARDAADHYAASDLTGSNHWVERTEMVEREVPL